jgi:hypothetical protein
MKVEKARDLDGSHRIEVGAATWDANARSVRNRFDTPSGHFNLASSSEVPIGDLVPMLELVADHDELSVGQCARIIEVLSTSIRRRSG